jgi:hypothetical protein
MRAGGRHAQRVTLLGQVGFFTAATELLATAVAAGILLGGFLAGSVGIFAGWPRSRRDERVVLFGYAGGMIAILLVLIDLSLRYDG